MGSIDQNIRGKAIEAAAARLVYGAKIAKLNKLKIGGVVKAKFPGGDIYELKIEHPGVLRLYDLDTSVVWSESIIDAFDKPNPDFCPPLAK